MLVGSNSPRTPRERGDPIFDAKFQFFALGDGDRRVREYKKRRTHLKTNSGCIPCKVKRVKCDELRPSCARCRRNDRACEYGAPRPPKSRQNKFSVLDSVTVIPFSAPSAQNGTPIIYLMQHLARHWTEILDVACTDQVLELYKSHPLVRNALLAVAACHLRNMSPGVLQHRIAEHFQQYLALQDYQKLISMTPADLGQSGVNAMMFSAVLLNMLSFALPVSEIPGDGEPNPSTSWVFRPHDGSLGWLVLQEGPRHLLKSTTAYLGPAMEFLGQIFLEGGDDPWTYSTLPSNMEGVPKNWIRLFGLENIASDGLSGSSDLSDVRRPDRQSHAAMLDSRGSAFHLPVLALSHSLNDSFAGLNVFPHFVFLSKVHTEFRALLYLRDEKALWIFGYWLGLISRHEGLWWCEKRVKRDYRAVRMWLEQARVTSRPEPEGELWREMMVEYDNVILVPR